jgi:hypothetical protein
MSLAYYHESTTVSEMKHIHLKRSGSVMEWFVNPKRNTEVVRGFSIPKGSRSRKLSMSATMYSG